MNSLDKITALRALLPKHNLNGFIIPRADEHQGEFVAPASERLKWMTGFSGSAGIACVLEERAVVMSDGRYSIQLKSQIDAALYDTGDMIGTGLGQWLAEHAPDHAVIGYDPMLHTPSQIAALEEKLEATTLKLIPCENLIDEIWNDRPAPPPGAIEIFPALLAGKSHDEKIKEIAAAVEKAGANACILSKPDSVSWLLNVRGSDIPYLPAVLSYAIVYASGDVRWIIDEARITPALRTHLGERVETVSPELLIPKLMTCAIKAGERPIMMDYSTAPVHFKVMLEDAGAEVIDKPDPCAALKAVKSEAEIAAIKKAHEADALALVRFLRWVEDHGANGDIDEVQTGEKITEFRAASPAFRGESFPPICGFGANGAIVHYRADTDSCSAIKGDGLLLIDSGGQYLDAQNGLAGTTDLTRTLVIGTPSEEMRERFTLVLKGHIALARARFPNGTTGAQIDTFARAPLWAHSLDYAHGTGHGVGCYLDVHEPAASISPRGKQALKAGMLLSNEPGYYKEGAYGIRIENLVLVRPAPDNPDTGDAMLEFETISLAPIDRSLIKVELLDQGEIEWINAYHARLYAMLKPHAEAALKDWLKEKTAPLTF